MKHKAFYYHGYSVYRDNSGLVFSFDFALDDIRFNPIWRYDGGLLSDFDLSDAFLDYAVFNLGMAELVSYWKCACPETIYINCGSLTNYQIDWWKKLYRKGLGEFFYRNGLNPSDDFVKIISKYSSPPKLNNDYDGHGVLIPVGGGKDSVVTMELLRGGMADNLCYIINPRRPVVATALAAGYHESRIIGVGRTIDKELLRLNSEGYLNGHTPFSAIVAFSSRIFAYMSGKKYVALSNESSANETNVIGSEINHQYSKSTEFEADFREYTKTFMGAYPEYFSLLRPLSEWQITKKFSQYPKYHGIFQSCNVGSKTDTWCVKCAKCLYVYIMLAAFLSDESLIGIFGANMLDNAEFKGLFDALVYPEVDKPFECVGTKAEINLALHHAYKTRAEAPPSLLKDYMEGNPEKPEDLDNFFDKNNFVPKEFLCLID